jgi:orotate phosphoribosyltransferase-like protein
MMTQLKLRGEGLTWREIDDEVVALDVESATYLSANASGRLLWRSLSEGATRQELVSCLVDEFEIDAERAGADVDAFLAELSKRGLLES